MVTMLQWISPLFSISCAFKEAAGQQISLCRIPLWPQPTSSQLCPVSREPSPFQIKPVTGRFPQSETRTNLTVARHLEALVVLEAEEALEGLARGSVGSMGCSLTRVGGCYAHPWPRGGAHTAAA